ncbi:hypothetical protein [Georgenia satyanarayanai]|uniref:hypothetical protein n=1 Tax=Georgenia satyanarayanai TaxID=860221 RepID=UPI001263FDC9|nr:hypothetical protein [Georgenia satyanarayanai]
MRMSRPAVRTLGRLLGVTLLGLLAGAGTDGPPVPDDVAAWFAEHAATTAMTAGLTEEADGPAAVGGVFPLHRWSEAVRTGEPTEVPLVPREEWVAAYSRDGAPAGTLVAWRDAGGVTLASIDDHAELAEALAALSAGSPVVEEPMLGAFFTILDEEVTTLVPGFYEGPRTAPLVTFSETLTAQLEGMVGGAAEPEPEGGRWLPVAGAVGAGLVGACGIWLARRWRATSAAPPT